jgi:hypothetical protein
VFSVVFKEARKYLEEVEDAGRMDFRSQDVGIKILMTPQNGNWFNHYHRFNY